MDSLVVTRLVELFRAQERERVVSRAVEAGLLRIDQATEVEQVLAPQALDDLRAAQHRADVANAFASLTLPPEVEAAAADPARLVGEFVLVAPLGRGGMGEVWKAYDRTLRRWVAVKLSTGLSGDLESCERFRREALAVARLAHPGIVPVHRVGESRGRLFIAMSLVEGRSLAERRPSLDRVFDVMRHAALAVQHAHENGVVHRDLKPGNIMTDDEGRVWVLDFGIAHLLQTGATVTATGGVLGTPGYMSPEQARGEAAARSPAADIYALGATLYDLLVGQPPFTGATPLEVLRKATEFDVTLPSGDARLPRDVETVLLKCLDRDPGRRYATAGALAEDLGRLARSEPVLARRDALVVRMARQVRRRATPIVVAVAALAALSMTMTRPAGVWFRLRTSPEVKPAGVMADLQQAVAGRTSREAALDAAVAALDLDYVDRTYVPPRVACLVAKEFLLTQPGAAERLGKHAFPSTRARYHALDVRARLAGLQDRFVYDHPGDPSADEVARLDELAERLP